MSTGPNIQLALEKYRGLAASYDRLVRPAAGVRKRAVQRLDVKAGDTVLDVACGTGLSFALLEERIGPQGALIGIDMSPEMLARAQERVATAGWQNVRLINAVIADAEIPGEAAAALFHFTHDVLRTPAALENVLRHLRPGARVVAAGAKSAPRWFFPANAYIRRVSRQYVTTFEGFDAPWSLLEPMLAEVKVESALFGTGYVARGLKPPEG